MITILTGKKGVGKTTHLEKWLQTKSAIGGVLTPIINDRRVFVHYPDKVSFPMELDIINVDEIIIGKYCFSKDSFIKANELIIEDIYSHKLEGVIIDEIGPLELKGKGLFPALMRAVKIQNDDFKLYIVVRESLVDLVISKFDLKNKVEIKNTLSLL